MRRVILQEFVTLNGLAAGPDGSVDFIPASTRGDQRFGREQLVLMETVDTMLLGRVTYLMFAAHWPNVNAGEEQPFADRLNALHKIVFSRTLDAAPWGAREEASVVSGGPVEEITRLRQESGKDMVVWGSLSLAETLIRHNLVDEYRLVVCPIALSGGRALFNETVTPLRMMLVDVQPLDLGAVSLKYVPPHA
jgi:dihydrofolate reductase